MKLRALKLTTISCLAKILLLFWLWRLDLLFTIAPDALLLEKLLLLVSLAVLLLLLALRDALLHLSHHGDYLVNWYELWWLERKLGVLAVLVCLMRWTGKKCTVRTSPLFDGSCFYLSRAVTKVLTAAHMHVLPQLPACLGMSILLPFLATAGLMHLIPGIISMVVYSVWCCADFWLVHLPILLISHNQIFALANDAWSEAIVN